MIYVWECDDCHAETEVSRSVDSRHIGPDDGCCKCSSTKVSRVEIPKQRSNVKGFILEGTGWHDQVYSKYKSRQ